MRLRSRLTWEDGLACKLAPASDVSSRSLLGSHLYGLEVVKLGSWLVGRVVEVAYLRV